MHRSPGRVRASLQAMVLRNRREPTSLTSYVERALNVGELREFARDLNRQLPAHLKDAALLDERAPHQLGPAGRAVAGLIPYRQARAEARTLRRRRARGGGLER